MGMDHANTEFTVYGDMSSIMGACCDVPSCYNGPNQWQLGWSKTVADLDAGSVQPGKWLRYTLPELALDKTSILRVSVLPGSDPVRTPAFGWLYTGS